MASPENLSGPWAIKTRHGRRERGGGGGVWVRGGEVGVKMTFGDKGVRKEEFESGWVIFGEGGRKVEN